MTTDLKEMMKDEDRFTPCFKPSYKKINGVKHRLLGYYTYDDGDEIFICINDSNNQYAAIVHF